MGLTLDAKKAIVEEVAQMAATAPCVIAAEYTGLTVAEMTVLRKNARAAGVYLKVVRNTLARRAFTATKFECMRDGLIGPLMLTFSSAEPGSAARLIHDFAKDNDKLVVRLIALDGQLLEPQALEKLASMPSLDEARAMLLGLFCAPLSRFVRTLAEPQAQFTRLLAAKNGQQ